MAAGSDRTGDDPLTFSEALNLAAELFNDADRLVTDGQAFGDRVLAAQDVHVGAADCRGGYAHQRVGRPHFGDGFFIQNNAVLFNEDCRFHAGHGHFS
ncbi:hypothetical protein D3C81_693030 [compost metagenome]